MKIQIDGLDHMEKQFDKLSKSVRGEIAQEALEEAGEYFRQDAYNKCAVKGGMSADGFYFSEWDPTGRSGAVRESIKWKLMNIAEVIIFTNHMIAPDLEFGTSREQAKPFMGRAAQDKQTQKGIADIFARVLKKGIEKVI